MSGSTNLTLTVNGTSETLTNAVSAGTIDRIRFDTANTNSTYYIDGEIKVESTTNVVVNTQILLRDNFQSDAATTNGSTADFDPTIGLGDMGGTWDIREGSTANALPLAVQVINSITPADTNGITGPNNYLRIYRGGGVSSTGKPYATGWTTANTADQVMQLDMLVWQPSPGNGNTSAGLMNVMFGGAPQNNPSQATWLNSVSAWAALSDGIQSPIDLPDDQWNTVRMVVNLSSSFAQAGVPATNYTVSINGVTVLTNGFYTPHNTVQSVLVGLEGANENFDYLDDVLIQIISKPLTVSIQTLPDKNQALTFTGTPDTAYVVQAATNLTDWVSISTNTTDSAGQFIYSDLTATNHTQQFYRGRLP